MVFLELAFSREASAKTKTTVRLLQAFPLCSPGMFDKPGGSRLAHLGCNTNHGIHGSYPIRTLLGLLRHVVGSCLMVTIRVSMLVSKVPRLWFWGSSTLEIHDEKILLQKAWRFCPLIQGQKAWIYMGVSKNRGTPKWMVSNGKPSLNGWFGGTTIFGNIHIPVRVFSTTTTGTSTIISNCELFTDVSPGEMPESNLPMMPCADREKLTKDQCCFGKLWQYLWYL